MKPKKVVLKLTSEQIEGLTDLNQIVLREGQRNKPGMLLAQLHPEQGLMICGFILNEYAAQIQATVNPGWAGKKTTEKTNWKKLKSAAGIIEPAQL